MTKQEWKKLYRAARFLGPVWHNRVQDNAKELSLAYAAIAWVSKNKR